MANIIKLLLKERERGNRYIMPGGDIVPREKLEKVFKVEYVKTLKAGELDTEKSYAEFFEEFREQFLTVNDLIAAIHEALGDEEEPKDKEPDNTEPEEQEETENVLQETAEANDECIRPIG